MVLKAVRTGEIHHLRDFRVITTNPYFSASGSQDKFHLEPGAEEEELAVEWVTVLKGNGDVVHTASLVGGYGHVGELACSLRIMPTRSASRTAPPRC